MPLGAVRHDGTRGAQAVSRLVTFTRLANGRFTHQVEDTATCTAASHRGGGIRWVPATAALATALLVGVAAGIVGSPDPEATADVVPSPTPSPSPLVVYVPVTPSPGIVATPPPQIPIVTPVPAPTSDPTPAPVVPQVIVIQVPSGSSRSAGSSGSTIVRTVERTVVREVTVTVTPAPTPSPRPTCFDPGLHLGRSCKSR